MLVRREVETEPDDCEERRERGREEVGVLAEPLHGPGDGDEHDDWDRGERDGQSEP
jgi:hypothetical protein